MSKKKFNDWRLPTIEELLTLVNYDKTEPACDLNDIDSSSSGYWSSTTNAYYTNNAWYVNFNYGNSNYNNKTANFYVRCVRDGKNGLEWSKSSKDIMNWKEANTYAKSLNKKVYYKSNQQKESIMEKTNNTKTIYRHVRIPGKERTIAAQLIDGVYQYGIAYCHENDQYCKATGRKLAESRLTDGTLTLKEILNYFDDSPFTKSADERIRKLYAISDFKSEVILNLIMEKENTNE